MKYLPAWQENEECQVSFVSFWHLLANPFLYHILATLFDSYSQTLLKKTRENWIWKIMSSKRKCDEDLNLAKKKKTCIHTSTEDLFLRFPHLRDGIFDLLDDKNLAKCKEISRIWCQILETEKLYWIRKIQNVYRNLLGHKEEWMKLTQKKMSFETLKKLAEAVHFRDEATMEIFDSMPLNIGGSYKLFVRWIIFKHCTEVGFASFPSGGLTMATLAMNRRHNREVANPTHVHPAIKSTGRTLGNSHLCAVRKRCPTIVAAIYGDIDLFKDITKILKTMNPANDRGVTALHFAAKKGNLDICKYISENVTDKNPRDTVLGYTPLHDAALYGRLEVYKYIAQNVKEVPPKTFHGDTPLHTAVYGNEVETFKFIFKNSENKAPTNRLGFTPFHTAVVMGHLEIIKVLTENVEHKNILNETDLTGKTARGLAFSLGQSEKCPEMNQKYEEIRKLIFLILECNCNRTCVSAKKCPNFSNFSCGFLNLIYFS